MDEQRRRGRWREGLAGRWPGGVAVALLLGLGGCGGGGEPSFELGIHADFSTAASQVMLSGSVSLPEGSERAGGTPSLSIVTCQLGPHTLTWSNAATGASGPAFAMWDCPDAQAHWAAPGIALAMGANRVTVTMRDSHRSAQATVTVTRQ